MKKIILAIILFATVSLIFGCTRRIPEDGYNDLVTNLEKIGFNVLSEDVEKDIFEGERKWLTINDDENMSVYLYENNEKMEEDASHIDKGGSSYINGGKSVEVDWVSFPHFFKKDNIIVIYVGENLEIINALKEIMGLQFAGYGGTEQTETQPGETEGFDYNNFKVEITNVENVRVEKILDDGGNPWEYKVIRCYPNAIATVLEADMGDPSYNADGKSYPSWGILLESDERIKIVDGMEPFEITPNIIGIYSLEASLYILKFEVIE